MQVENCTLTLSRLFDVLCCVVLCCVVLCCVVLCWAVLQSQMLLEVVNTARKKLRGHSYYE